MAYSCLEQKVAGTFVKCYRQNRHRLSAKQRRKVSLVDQSAGQGARSSAQQVARKIGSPDFRVESGAEYLATRFLLL
jgi:hypothetical protein